MLSLLDFMQDTFLTAKAVAKYLGYTPRHLYNIRKRLQEGGTLHANLEVHILQRTLALKEELRKGKRQ
jgi:CRP-like cAMP-binding protein